MKKLFISIPSIALKLPREELFKRVVARVNEEGFCEEIVGKNLEEKKEIKQYVNSGQNLTIIRLAAQAGFKLAQKLNNFELQN